MTDFAVQTTLQTERDEEVILTRLLTEIQRANDQIQNDQAAIDRLKAETRVISAHSDRLFQQIAAQLDFLRKVARSHGKPGSCFCQKCIYPDQSEIEYVKNRCGSIHPVACKRWASRRRERLTRCQITASVTR
jgi:hypothetical protein